ncbi:MULTISPECIES: chemotaxis protein CheD [Bacillaceae]|uniref:Probable chemoreceptor glutamine deamidase CheD n=1 Tax=Metabacillus endolithicus TaxID=1535204 RepID=A0ABW5BVG7_9BACI|nr:MULTISPECIES: chemotaxis protein CheD [Bacillaceae]PGT86690.1 chemotaxis protein CheD [Bacillus sp. AFS040349]UGB32696.1 chemotaxis protein CheD [Metabacillus sp. B2-18]UHA59270.1 chemotaxis protein CheD [Metabacillus litoralis]UPG63273.1 chemotaxis protein CheD [Metabacillus endolithicus]
MKNESIEIVKVGIADLNIVKSPQRIRTSGLGSCVGLILFDRIYQIAGLAHVMLPDSTLANQSSINQAKYADTAVPLLIDKLVEAGAKMRSLQAKMAGGAQMFQFQTTSDMMRIGPRNVEAVKEVLKSYNIPLLKEDVGGNSGRTIEFDPITCELMIRTVNQGVKII